MDVWGAAFAVAAVVAGEASESESNLLSAYIDIDTKKSKVVKACRNSKHGEGGHRWVAVANGRVYWCRELCASVCSEQINGKPLLVTPCMGHQWLTYTCTWGWK